MVRKKMSLNQRKNELAQIVSYTPPRLYTGKEWYVGWYSYDPVLQRLRRKKSKSIIFTIKSNVGNMHKT